MYLFSTFNNNANYMLNKKKEYKELVCMAEVELNLELDNIKKGNINLSSETASINSGTKDTKKDFEKNEKLSAKKLFGAFKEEKEFSNEEKIIISKKVEVVDKSRGVYVVVVDASKNDESVRLEGYEQWREDGVIVSSE